MTVGAAGTEIVGRETELDAVETFIAAADSSPRALVLVGEPGIGKTTLWRHAVSSSRAEGTYLVVAAPAESERELPFVVLHDLFGPLLDAHAASLAPARLAALEAALLRTPTRAPADRLAVSVAALDLIRAATRETSLVLAVDDVQWLDTPTQAVLTFALRRLDHEPVTVVCASRPPRMPTCSDSTESGSRALT
jgi:predicted ATPase